MFLTLFLLEGQNTHADCLNHYIPIIPPPLKASSQIEERKKLPTWSNRDDILELVSKNQVKLKLLLLLFFKIVVNIFYRRLLWLPATPDRARRLKFHNL